MNTFFFLWKCWRHALGIITFELWNYLKRRDMVAILKLFSYVFKIERAHRVPSKGTIPGAPPHSTIIKHLSLQNRECIMKQPRSKEVIFYNDAKLFFFSDFYRIRGQILQLKKRLQFYQLEYAILYPAELKIVFKGSTHLLVY